MTVDNTDIVIELGASYNLTVFLFLNGNPVLDAYFFFTGINLDIGESQNYHSNGKYMIYISENTTINIAPHNYSCNLVASHNGLDIIKEMNISITSTDSIAPTLTLIYPDILQNFTESIFKIKLIIEDETEWRDVNITLGSQNLGYFRKIFDEFNNTEIIYNQTYLYFESWISLLDIKNINSNQLLIIAQDTSFNAVNKTIVLSGDYEKPIISWTSHFDNANIHEREITLSWEVEDNSEILEQILKLNGIEFLVQKLEPETRSVKFVLPMADPATIVFSLKVIDIYDNYNEIFLTLIFNTEIDDNGNFFELSESSPETKYALGIVFALGLISIIVIIIKSILSKNYKRKPSNIRFPEELFQEYSENDRIIQFLKSLKETQNVEDKNTFYMINNEIDLFKIDEIINAEDKEKILMTIQLWLDQIQKERKI
ncbi:MAG: hypothetical protein INQ03_24650 [Candidatus Heimdallarchaeota archaeon]|nr:hypothetical protein [Candidatus Heimdallarchaeota archaeon]